VELSFYAEPGKRYRLYRTSELQIELWPPRAGRKAVRSDAKAVVAQDEEFCVWRREREIENQRKDRRIDLAEAIRLRAKVDAECRLLVWG